MRNEDGATGSLVLGRDVRRSGEVRRAEMFASTLFTGLREDEDDEVAKLRADAALRVAEALDNGASSVERDPIIGHMAGDLVEYGRSRSLSEGVCSSVVIGRRLSEEIRKDELRYVGCRSGEQTGQSLSRE